MEEQLDPKVKTNKHCFREAKTQNDQRILNYITKASADL